MATQEQKIQAVVAAKNRGKKTMEQVAEKFGISATTLHNWRNQLEADGVVLAAPAEPEAAKPNGHGAPPIDSLPQPVRAPIDVWEENTRLRAENAELRSLLKKLL